TIFIILEVAHDATWKKTRAHDTTNRRPRIGRPIARDHSPPRRILVRRLTTYDESRFRFARQPAARSHIGTIPGHSPRSCSAQALAMPVAHEFLSADSAARPLAWYSYSSESFRRGVHDLFRVLHHDIPVARACDDDRFDVQILPRGPLLP